MHVLQWSVQPHHPHKHYMHFWWEMNIWIQLFLAISLSHSLLMQWYPTILISNHYSMCDYHQYKYIEENINELLIGFMINEMEKKLHIHTHDNGEARLCVGICFAFVKHHQHYNIIIIIYSLLFIMEWHCICMLCYIYDTMINAYDSLLSLCKRSLSPNNYDK